VECSQYVKCGNCDPDKTCFDEPNYYIYTVDEYGTVAGEADMMNEI